MSVTTNMDLLRGAASNSFLRNQDAIQYNELNANSNGGTELTTRRMFDFLSADDIDGVQFVASRVRELDDNKIKIYIAHDLVGDPETDFMKDQKLRERFDKLVFSSNWQYQQFRDYLNVPFSQHSAVIETGIDPIPLVNKPMDKIKLIYTSTPHRGLEILVPVFVQLAKIYPDIQLDVYSSFGIYGWEERDAPYEPLFKICREHPQINYHGWQPNDVVRKAYQEAHIFAYPNIWPETSCRSLIEAMSAGCLCIHPNFAALPDTAGGLTVMYDGDMDVHIHANIFAHTLMHAVDNIKNNDLTGLLSFIKGYADVRFSWDNIGNKWKGLIASLKADKK